MPGSLEQFTSIWVKHRSCLVVRGSSDPYHITLDHGVMEKTMQCWTCKHKFERADSELLMMEIVIFGFYSTYSYSTSRFQYLIHV